MTLRDVYALGQGVPKDEKQAQKYEARLKALDPVNKFDEQMEQEKMRQAGTPPEGKKMSQNETAKEQVRRVFSNYWLVVNGTNYLTKVLPGVTPPLVKYCTLRS